VSTSRTRRVLFLALAAAALAMVVALALTRDVGTAATVVSLVLALCGAGVGTWRWLEQRAAPRVSTPEQLDAAARALAETVESQWRAEAAVRGLSSPNPARWVATRRPVADAAASRWWTGTVATGSDPRARGGLEEIVQCYRDSPSGRLVILGAAGTGKTATAVLLVLAALRAREAGDPVPALTSIASWDPHAEHLVDYIAVQLNRDHPYLMNSEYGGAAATGLLTSGRVTPVLDGFDELAPDRRAAAVTGLNRSGVTRMIVTSRPDEYEDATDAVVLAGAAVVELLPLDLDAVVESISAGCAPRRLVRWEQVLTAMRADPSGPLPTALTNPLALALARQTYGDRDPAELLDGNQFGTARAVRDHLLDRFVPAQYDARPERDDPTGRPPLRYDGRRALRWLAFLAGQLERRRASDLAWWHIPQLVRPGLRALASVLAFACLAWLISEAVWGGHRLLGIALAGPPLIAVRMARQQGAAAAPPATLGRVSGRRRLRRSLATGARTGLVTAATVAVAILLRDLIAPPEDTAYGALPIVLATGLVFGVTVGGIATIGAAVRHSAPTTAPHPRRSFRSHLLFLFAGRILPTTLVICLIILISVPADDVPPSLDNTLLPALAYSLLVGAAFALPEAAGQYIIAVGMLAVSGKAPWRPLRFLADAHRRGVLRQQGATYQFRHAELQTRLAASWISGSPADSGARPGSP
jgi:hypothetical protein